MSETSRERVERALALVTTVGREGVVGASRQSDAEHAARFFERHYEPRIEGDVKLPGIRGAGAPEWLAADIDYILGEIQAGNVALTAPEPDFPVDRVRALLRQVQAALAWRGDEDATLGAQAARLKRNHVKARRTGDWVIALCEHVRLARQHEASLRTIEAFDPARLDEAEALLRAWRAREVPDTRAVRARQAALGVLLLERMRRIWKAADFVFADFPAVAREARSERVRANHAAAMRSRRRNRRAEEPATPAQPSTPAEPASPA